MLRTMPVPKVALEYYEARDMYVDLWGDTRIRWRQMSSLVQRDIYLYLIILTLSVCVFLCVTLPLLCHHTNILI